MGLGVVGHQRHVGAAQHDRDAAAPEHCGELVGPHRRPRDDGHADEVRLQIGRQGLDALVDDHELSVDFGGHEGGEGGQGERCVAQRPPEDPAPMAVQRPLGRDQGDSQRVA